MNKNLKDELCGLFASGLVSLVITCVLIKEFNIYLLAVGLWFFVGFVVLFSEFIVVMKIATSPERFYIRRYENIDLVEYIKVKYIFDFKSGIFTLRGWQVMGWQPINMSSIIDYEHELQSQWIEPLTEEQYDRLKMFNELRK